MTLGGVRKPHMQIKETRDQTARAEPSRLSEQICVICVRPRRGRLRHLRPPWDDAMMPPSEDDDR
jgi:hypothetical protein